MTQALCSFWFCVQDLATQEQNMAMGEDGEGQKIKNILASVGPVIECEML